MKLVDTLKFPDSLHPVKGLVLCEKEVWSTGDDSGVAVWNSETG